MPSQLQFPSALTFFGLTSTHEVSQYRLILFSQIHDIVFHGNGGYDWNTIYNMPVWLRKFTFNKIKEWNEKKAEAANNNSNEINLEKPDLLPTHIKNLVSKNPPKKPSIKAS